MIEIVLNNSILAALRNKNVISENEVAVQIGDLYYAKNILTTERRMIPKSMINGMVTSEVVSESNERQLLKG